MAPAIQPLRIVFMGTPAFAVPILKTLIDSDHELVGVYTQPPRPAHRGQKETPSPVHLLAMQHQISVFHPVSLKSVEEQEKFKALGADVAIVAAYGLLLPKPILEACPMGCINVHPSLLPRWRGAAPIQRTIMAGDEKTGICIMQMDAELDTGDVILKKEIPLSPLFWDAGGLHDELSHRSGALLLEALHGLQDKTLTPEKQSEAGVTYAKKITKAECRIDWTKPATEIAHQILGLSPHPGAYFSYKGEHIKLLGVRAVLDGNWPEAGIVLDDYLTISCGSGSLQPDLLQRPGKKPLSKEEFLRGFSIPKGEVLE